MSLDALLKLQKSTTENNIYSSFYSIEAQAASVGVSCKREKVVYVARYVQEIHSYQFIILSPLVLLILNKYRGHFKVNSGLSVPKCYFSSYQGKSPWKLVLHS